MNWYYAESGQKLGPFGEADWGNLISSGKIKPDTLVWREGMASWQSYATASASGAPVSTSVVSANERCSECGNFFPVDEVVTIEGHAVCAGCKPVLVQKLKEGVQLTGELVYAGFWIRFGAKMIDSIILLVLGMLIGAVIGGILGATMGITKQSQSIITIASGACGLLLRAAYMIYFVGKYSATPGKMACGLKVVRPDGSSLTYGRACGRFFAEWLSGLTLCIGYLMAGFDEEKRTLHDRVADTRVIKA